MNEDLEIFDHQREFTFFELINRYYKYGNWITNISISLLGFYIAIMLHYKSIPEPIIIYLALPIVLLLISSVGIGIYLKIKYDVKYKHDVIFDNIMNFMDKKDLTLAMLIKETINIFKHNPKPYVITQFILVSLSLLIIMVDLVRYFFFY